MEIVKRTSEYTIVKKRNGRYGVQAKGRQWVNADEKVKILMEAGLIKTPEAKPAEPEAEPEAEPVVEAAAEETVEEAVEETAEVAPEADEGKAE